MKYSGVIKSFNPQKGWGFIECEQTQLLYGKDMFVLKNALPGGTASKGDEVSFTVVQEHNGPIATDVQLLKRAPVMPGAGLSMPLAPAGLSCAPALNAFNGAGAGSLYSGTVKSFSMETGWGMISSPEMMQMYGKDIFFSKNAVQGGYAAPGEQVRFSIKMEAKGPAAATVQVLWRPQPMVGPPRPKFPPLPSPYAVAGMWPPMGPPMGAKKMPSKDQTFFGVLKSFSEDKGWGHITCEATSRLYGKDVFLMRGALNNQVVQPKQLLSFKVHLGAKGPQANMVTLLPPGSFRTEGEVEEVTTFTGHIKSFNEEKGWGFITGEDLQGIFGKDIFVHKRELDGSTPQQGEEVQFSVEIDEGGQPVAKSASLSTRSYDAARSAQTGLNARVAPY